MGLGKTIMVIALILANRPQKSQTLIIAPLSVIKQWEDQVKRFAPGLKVLVIN
jgi:SNF2 family DNA or RNA helicase